jgi:hypothetical protein
MEQTPSMNADVYNNITQCNDELDFISGQHDYSLENLGGVKAASAIQELQEEDDTMIGPVISNFEQAKAGYMSYLLKIIQQKYDIPRTVNLVNKGAEIESIDFKGSDLTSTQVRIESGSSLPISKTAKRNYVLTLVNAGILNPVTDKGLILKTLQMGFADDLYEEYSVDQNYAMQEQDKWLKGMFSSTTVRDFFNHQVHIQEHNKFRMSDEYLKLAEQTGCQSLQFIDSHVNMHEAFLLGMNSDEIKQFQNLPTDQQEQILNDMKSQQQQPIPQPVLQNKPQNNMPVNPLNE